MNGNLETRVIESLNQVQGPLAGSNLLEAFKAQLAAEPVFQIMFGERGERIYVGKMPSVNESILPALILVWKSETFTSLDTYLEGNVEGMLCLPTQLEGDFNSLRRVGSAFQRFMSTRMQLYSGVNKVAGLIMFGYGTQFDYSGLGTFSGIKVPVIQMAIPFKFDLQLLQSCYPGIDFTAPMDNAELAAFNQIFINILNSDTSGVLIADEINEDGT